MVKKMISNIIWDFTFLGLKCLLGAGVIWAIIGIVGGLVYMILLPFRNQNTTYIPHQSKPYCDPNDLTDEEKQHYYPGAFPPVFNNNDKENKK